VAQEKLNYANWWKNVWFEPTPPVTSTYAAENETSWLKAYKVPGTEKVIRDRHGEPVQAICLSGGGVRSACVAMGVTQIFSEAEPVNPKKTNPVSPPVQLRLIDTVDYVISVSGGGYTAGARLLATQPQPPGKACAAKPPGEASAAKPLLSQRFQQGSAEFDYFRRHSSYIADSPASLVDALAVVLKNLIASLAMLFTVPAVLGWGFGYLLAVPYFSFAAFAPVTPEAASEIKTNPRCPDALRLLLAHHDSSWLAVGSFVVLTVVCTMIAVWIEWFWAGPPSETLRKGLITAARGCAVFAALVFVVVAGLPALMLLCSKVGKTPVDAAKILPGVIGVNYVAAIVTMVARKRDRLPLKDVATSSGWRRLLPPAVLQLILVLGTFALLALAWLAVLGSFALDIFQRAAPRACGSGLPTLPDLGSWVELVLLGTALLFLGFADVTSLSLHPFYRRRLASTFALRRVESEAQSYPATEWTWLPTYGQAPPGGPKFIFATAATLSGAAAPAPGLSAVSYVLSADYIGSPQLGWLDTRALFAIAPPRIRRDLTVEAAVAVSGAAFASAMGRQNKGYQKLLALSGARLGTWLPNPKLVGNLYCVQKGNCADKEDEKRPWPTSLATIRGAGYFYRELFGINYDDARLVQLTDGGHYENLGLVEALRRRCRLIFCIDAGGDAPPLLSSLSDAMRLAKYELGVTIELNEQGSYSVNDLAPGSGRPFPEEHAFACLNSRITKGTVAFGKITYPSAAGVTKLPKPYGVLVFAKAVLWEGCPDWLLTYAASSQMFPHDPTSDQWFNEAQFAAYTALGRIMGNHAVECVDWLRRNAKS
jgi:hypothetical protein